MTPAMTKAFDLPNLLARIKDSGLPVAEANAKVASIVVLGWTGKSCALEGGLVAMIAAGMPYVQQQLIALEDKIDGVAGDNDESAIAVPASISAMTKAFDISALVSGLEAEGLPMAEADAKLLTGSVLDWVGDSCVLEGGLVAMIAPGIPYLKQQILVLEDKISPASV